MRAITSFMIVLLFAARASAAQEIRFVSISAGLMHTCALDKEGQAYCWGVNDGGQLGMTGSETCAQEGAQAVPCSRRPVRVATDARFVQVTAGEWHTCALTREGEAYCWGSPMLHLLGIDSAAPPVGNSMPKGVAPVRTAVGLRFQKLSAGSFHTCGITTDTLVACWGSNNVGQLGSDTLVESCQAGEQDGKAISLPCRRQPVAVGAGTSLPEADAGGGHTCALDAAGTVYCWGAWVGGNPKAGSSPIPKQLETPTPLHALDCGSRMSLALSQEGLPFEWGLEWRGKVAVGIPKPTFPANLAAARESGPFFVTAVAGEWHRCGLTSDGTAYCWGPNSAGQLGTGKGKDVFFTSGDKWNPGRVTGQMKFRQLTAGSHTCGLTDDGTAYCWGQNTEGQLGIGAKDRSRREPTQVVAPSQP